MNCETAKIQVVAYLKGELNETQRRRLEEHLARCPACREELEKARNVMNWVDAASDDAVVALVEDAIAQTIEARASDLHFEPAADGGLRVRIRIDGALQDCKPIPPVQRPGVIARLKMLAKMNVGQTSLPQQGRYAWDRDGKEFDLRVSCVPLTGGEGIVVRMLDRGSVFVGLEKLCLSVEQLQAVRELLAQPNGLILMSGPNGSGKTTTCYSMLQEIRNDQIKMMSVENPVEFLIPGVCQVQLNPSAGYTAAEAMRAIMRSDPDVIFIADLDGADTVKSACEAALTGHLVIAQANAESAIEACRRLLHLDVDPYYLSATLLASISQRLVRKVCLACRERLTDAEKGGYLLASLGISQEDLDSRTVYVEGGCEQCRHTGFRGRAAIYEMLIANAASARAFVDGDFAPRPDWNYTAMLDDARAKVLAGVTSPAEARRVLF